MRKLLVVCMVLMLAGCSGNSGGGSAEVTRSGQQVEYKRGGHPVTFEAG